MTKKQIKERYDGQAEFSHLPQAVATPVSYRSGSAVVDAAVVDPAAGADGSGAERDDTVPSEATVFQDIGSTVSISLVAGLEMASGIPH